MVDLKKIYGNAFKDIIDELYSYISAENNGRNVIDLNSYVFDGKDASDIKYLGHYNIHDAFLLLKEIAENNNIDINISAEISLSDLSGYINGDVYNFKFIIKNECRRYLLCFFIQKLKKLFTFTLKCSILNYKINIWRLLCL